MSHRALVIGDATLDITVRHAEPPQPGTDAPADISIGPGGQGANVAVRLARRGWDVRLLTVLGTDDPGQLIGHWLEAEGVVQVGDSAPASGVVLSMVDAAGERGMLSQRTGFPVRDVTADALQTRASDVDWVHASGYALGDPLSGIELARGLATLTVDRRVSVGGGSFRDDAVAARWRTVRPHLSVFDRREGAVVAERVAASDELARQLAGASGGVVVITEGAAGAVAGLPDGPVVTARPAAPVAASDTTGAGDAFTAALIDALAGAGWPPDAGRLAEALQAAALVGARVASVLGAQGRIVGERRTAA